MSSTELAPAVIASVVGLASVLLACSCLYYRIYRRKKRCPSNSIEKGRSDNPNSCTPGITNIACDDARREADIYETCNEIDVQRNVPTNDVYDYVTILEPNYDVCNEVRENGLNSENKTADSPDDSAVYAVLEGPSEEHVTSDPIYFTLENNSSQTTKAEQISENEGYSGRMGNDGMDRDTHVGDIHDDIYENVRDPEGDEVTRGPHGIDKDTTGDLDDHTDGSGEDNEGYTDDEGMHGDACEREDHQKYEEEDESPDEGIYANWEETICKKEQDCFDGIYTNEDATTTREPRSDDDFDTMENVEAELGEDSGLENIYENMKDVRNSLASEKENKCLNVQQ